MQTKSPAGLPSEFLRFFLCILFLLGLVSLSLAQDANYTQQGLQIARDLVEEERESPLRISRWRYFQDDWSTQAHWQQYGAFGIDSCVAEVIPAEKRDILFGWTFTITDVSGKSWQVRVSFDLLTAVLCDEVITTAPADNPAASSAPVEIAPGAANVGGFELGGQVTGLTDDADRLLKQAGMKWVKQQLTYSDGDQSVERGRIWIQTAHAKGFKILLSVKGVHADLLPLEERFDNYTNNFAAFLRKLAQAGADAIEVWNEPNIEREWPLGLIDGEKYTEMLKKAYEAIKGPLGAPNTMVISAAPSPTGFFGAAGCAFDFDRGTGGCNDDTFMRDMAEAGAAKYMDCLGLHYNEGILPPSAASGDPRGGYPTYYFGSMLNRGAQFFPGKPVCWTEIGYLSGEGMKGPLPGGFAWAKDTTVQQQADWIAQAAVLSAQSGQVRLMIVWNMNFTVYGADPQAGFALRRRDGSCPGCDTLRTAMGG